MKKYFSYAFAGAIALTGAVGFASCSTSGEDVVSNINQPDYNPSNNSEQTSVKTEFVINVTQPQERATTRMTSVNAGNGAFQGLNDIYLLSFTAIPGTSSTIASTQVHHLSGYPSASLSSTVTDNSSKWYTLYLPNGTSNFLFYAKTTSGDPTDKAALGKLNFYNTSTSTVNDIAFSLSPIATSEATSLSTAETTLKGFLNTIATTTNWAGSVTHRDNNETSYKALADAYQQFISVSTDGYRQGSAKAILSTVGDLYSIMSDIIANESNTDVKDIATAVKNNIEANFTISGTATFKDTNLPSSTTNYPVAQGLPAGSAILKFNSTESPSAPFDYKNDGTSSVATIGTPMASFTYPSELAYYCNSDLRATTSNVTTNTLPHTSSTWLSDPWTGWDQTSVDGNTRAVAMKNNVTFGVAQLHSAISSTVTDKKFTDNAGHVTTTDGITGNDIADQTIDLSTEGSYLKVTGIVIGSQPTTVGYDYLQKSTATGAYTVYDIVENGGGTGGKDLLTGAADYYTLLLDNFKTPGEQTNVNVALEFVASKDFYGHDGLIKKDQPFYLIGTLNIANGGTITWADHVSFKSGDTGYNVNRVFIRDAMTTANFTLSATSLQKAYSTIPDLRSTQMVFGLSVDLQWKAGLTFNIGF